MKATNEGPLVVVGDALLDRDVIGTADRLCPDAPAPVLDEQRSTYRPGGAALAAVFAAAGGRRTVLVARVGADAAGRRLHELLTAAGVQLVALPGGDITPVKTRFCVGSRVLLRWDRGESQSRPQAELGTAAADALAEASAILVSDYGRGVTRTSALRCAVSRRGSTVSLVWDPHPRGAAPVPGVALVTPNRREAIQLAGLEGAPSAGAGRGLTGLTECAAALRTLWETQAVAITLRDRGALLSDGDVAPVLIPAPAVRADDVCGAGDCFAAVVSVSLAGGAGIAELFSVTPDRGGGEHRSPPPRTLHHWFARADIGALPGNAASVTQLADGDGRVTADGATTARRNT